MRRKRNTVYPSTLKYLSYRSRKERKQYSIWSMISYPKLFKKVHPINEKI